MAKELLILDQQKGAQSTPVQSTCLDRETCEDLKKKIRSKFKAQFEIVEATRGGNKFKLKINFHQNHLKTLEKVLGGLCLEYNNTTTGMMFVSGIKKDTVVENTLSEETEEILSLKSVEEVIQSEEEVKDDKITEVVGEAKKTQIPQVAKDLLEVFNISEKNISECDGDILRMKFDISERGMDKLKFRELTLFCTLINGDGNAFIVDESIGEIIVECQKLRIPVSNTFRPVRKKALERLMEENGVFFNSKNGSLDGKIRHDDVSMRMVLNFKLDRVFFLEKFRKRLQESGFRVSFVNENAQSILIINYRFVEKNLQYFELLERSQERYLRSRFLKQFISEPKIEFKNFNWHVTPKKKDFSQVSMENFLLKLQDAGYDYVKVNGKEIILPSFNPKSGKMLEREIPENHKNRHPEEEKMAVPVVTTIVSKKERAIITEQKIESPVVRFAKLTMNLTDEEASQVLDLVSNFLKNPYEVKKNSQLAKQESEEVKISNESTYTLSDLIEQMLDAGIVFLDGTGSNLYLPSYAVKVASGGKWKINKDLLEGLTKIQIVHILQK